MPRPAVVASLAIAAAFPQTGSAAIKWFHSPSGNIQCEVASRAPQGTYAYCQTFRPARSARLRANGRTTVCVGVRCLGNGPENAFVLRYGTSVRVGIFRCTSRTTGVRCVVIRSGHGFRISRERIVRF